MRSFNKKPHEPYDRCIAFCTVTSLPAPCASSPPCRSVIALPQPKNPSNSPTKARAEKPAHSPQRRHTQGAPGQRSEDAGNHSFSKERYGPTGGWGGGTAPGGVPEPRGCGTEGDVVGAMEAKAGSAAGCDADDAPSPIAPAAFVRPPAARANFPRGAAAAQRGASTPRARNDIADISPPATTRPLTPMTTVSSPLNLGMNLSPRRISASLRGRKRHITLMLHSAGSAISAAPRCAALLRRAGAGAADAPLPAGGEGRGGAGRGGEPLGAAQSRPRIPARLPPRRGCRAAGAAPRPAAPPGLCGRSAVRRPRPPRGTPGNGVRAPRPHRGSRPAAPRPSSVTEGRGCFLPQMGTKRDGCEAALLQSIH